MDTAFEKVRNIFGESRDYLAFYDLKELKEYVDYWLESSLPGRQQGQDYRKRWEKDILPDEEPLREMIEASGQTKLARSFEDMFDSSEEFYEAVFDSRLRHIFSAIGEAVFYIAWIALAVVGWALLWEATSAAEDVRWQVVVSMTIVIPVIAAVIAVIIRSLLPVVTQGVLMMRRHPEPVAAWRSSRKRWSDKI